MTTYATNNPLGSNDPRDLYDNAQNFDHLANDLANETYPDRLGNVRLTWHGMEEKVKSAIANLGWNPVGTFQGGAVLTSAGDIIQDETNLLWYRWDDLATLPKTVPAGSTPESTGGVGQGKWQPVEVSDVLRNDLEKPTGAAMIGATNSDGSTRTVQEFLIANDTAEFRAKNIAKLSSVNYMIRTKQPLTALFQGDSMTAGYDQTSTDIVPAENGDWATHASMNYPKRFCDFMLEQCGVTVTPVYRAISGYTAQQAVQNSAWQTNPNCDLAFVMYGINDAGGTDGATHESYMQNMETLIRRLIKWGCGVVVMTCAAGGQGGGSPLYQIWAQQVKNMAKVYGCRHFDAHEVQYNRIFGTVQSDNTHFNSIGYARFGEMLVSMCAAGGLLETYETVKHEIQTWPGSQSNSVGFCNPDGNMVTTFNAATYTNVGLQGAFPAAKRCVVSFHFYQSCEALEFDVVGSWTDGGLNCIAGNWYNPGTVPYYDLSYTLGNERSESITSSFVRSALYNKDLNRNGQPKFIGTLYGRGWKTITFHNALDGTAAANQFIQMLTLRPVPVRKVNTNRRGAQVGSAGVTRLLVPSSDGTQSVAPAAVSLTSVVLPMPEGLNGIAKDNKTQFYDCAIAKVIIKTVSGTFGTQYLEGAIYKSGTGVDTYTMTIITQTGGATIWPSFTFTRTQKQLTNTYAAGSVATNMPIRSVSMTATDVANGSGRAEMGDWLTIAADWTAVSGGAKTAYWNIELWCIDFNGAPIASAI